MREREGEKKHQKTGVCRKELKKRSEKKKKRARLKDPEMGILNGE